MEKKTPGTVLTRKDRIGRHSFERRPLGHSGKHKLPREQPIATTTKSDLTAAIAADAGISRSAAEAALSAILGAITDSLKAGNKVTLIGFGTFKVSERAARTGRNPQTKAPIQIAARRAVTFKAGSVLKSSIN